MRFSTSSKTILYDHPVISVSPFKCIKKALSYIVTKIPHQSTSRVGPTVIVTNHSIYTITKKQSRESTLSRDNDIYRDIRQYYKSQNAELCRSEDMVRYKNRLEIERELRHTIIREYQQQQWTEADKKKQHRHWIEHTHIDNEQEDHNKLYQKRPAWSITHDYIRDKRSNPHYLRILAAEHNSKTTSAKINPQCNKRKDRFVWGQKSSLRHVMNHPVMAF